MTRCDTVSELRNTHVRKEPFKSYDIKLDQPVVERICIFVDLPQSKNSTLLGEEPAVNEDL